MHLSFPEIPHLSTLSAGPLYELEQNILDNHLIIEAWLREAWLNHKPLITSSVDLRNSGFKLAPIDTNLFPAGFNNLNPEFYPLCIQAAQSVLLEQYPRCKNILIVPENHTRNPHYYQSVATLANIVHQAGYDVRIGSMLAQNTPIKVTTENDDELILSPILKKENCLVTDDFVPCLILLNNDLSDGIPDILHNIKQPIAPNPQLGWATRSKVQHFIQYQKVAESFAKLIDIDPWHIAPLFEECTEVDFTHKKGMEVLQLKTEKILSQIQLKYNQYNIEHKPFVFIKADAGTYGMAVMSVYSADEIEHLNRKQRLNMSTRKGRQAVHHFLIQEGVYTFENVGPRQQVAEPVVYMIGQHVIGGFYRVHQSRHINESLNAPGMHFEKLAFDECCNIPNKRLNAHDHPNRFYVYSVIARLALLAAAQEGDYEH